MLTIKNVAIICLNLLCGSFVFSQSPPIKELVVTLNGQEATGHAIVLSGTTEAIGSLLTDYLKTQGKVKRSGLNYTLTESALQQESTSPIYVQVTPQQSTVQVWAGVVDKAYFDKINKNLNELIHQFDIYYHQALIQKDIDQTQQALKAIAKQKARFEAEHEILNQKVQYNQKEKERLKNLTEQNQTEWQDLQDRIAKNQYAQDSVQLAGQQIEKVLREQTRKKESIN